MSARFLLLVIAYFVSIGGLASAQPTELRIEIKQDTSEASDEPSIQLVFDPDVSNRSVPLSPGLNYSISCTAPSGFDTSNKAWYRVEPNGTLSLVNHTSPLDRMSSAVYAFENNDGKISLRFQNFNPQADAGTYKCIAPADNKTLIISSSNPSVISGVKLVTALENTSPPNKRSFGMLISGNPHPNFTWTHEGAVIHDTDDDDILIVQNGPYIDILNIFRPFMFKHAGTYRVNATNDHGSTSDFFEIVIQVYPIITLNPPRNTIAYAVAGSPFQVSCKDTYAYPSPVFSWFFNDTPVTNNTDGFIIQHINTNVSVLSVQATGLSHAGVYKCESRNAAGADDEELELKIQLPPPHVPTVTVSSVSPTYAGGMIRLTCHVTLQTSSYFTSPLSANIIWSKTNTSSPINAVPGRISIRFNTESSIRYTSELSLQAASVSDSGLYVCGVVSQSGIYSSAQVNSTGTPLNIEVPPIPVSLSPTSYAVPNFHPYNSISFNCSITIPTGHAITSYFNWYRDNQMLLHGQDRISIVVKDHSSSLSFEATSAGMAKYRCSVILGFPSPDPNVTLSANSTVNVIGPKKPLLPTRITAGDFDYTSAVIQWTVPSIAYSPETYFIRYGTSQNNLNHRTITLVGTENLQARDQTLSITLSYLTHGTQYYYQVVSNNSYGETTSGVYTFSTSRLALIQFKAGPFLGCSNGRVADSDSVLVFLKDEISKAVSSSCSCSFPSSHLINGTILCPATNSEQLILRVFVARTNTLTSAAIVSYIKTWINGSPVLTSGVAKVTFDTSCPVNISNSQVSICTDTIVTTEVPTMGGVSDSFGSNTDILVAVVAGAVILLEAVIIVILFCALWHQNSKIRTLIRRRSSTYSAINRQNSSVGATDGPPPANKWKGDAYVTTECPAYLSAYIPKEIEDMDMVHIDENGRHSPPAIYDSIDPVNGRSVAMSVAPPPPPPMNHHPLSPHRNHDGHVTQSVLMSSEASDTEDNTGSSMMS